MDTVDGCDHPAISLVHRHGVIDTVGATDDVPPRVDAIQYETGQGPCLNSSSKHAVFLIDDLATDDRWPPFSHCAAEETGVRSMMSFRLFVEEDVLGALNLYSRKVEAFDEHACAVGTVLAAHTAIAMQAGRERDRADQLDRALATSREIGMAMGLIMAHRRGVRGSAWGIPAPRPQAAGHRRRARRDWTTSRATCPTGVDVTWRRLVQLSGTPVHTG